MQKECIIDCIYIVYADLYASDNALELMAKFRPALSRPHGLAQVFADGVQQLHLATHPHTEKINNLINRYL